MRTVVDLNLLQEHLARNSIHAKESSIVMSETVGRGLILRISALETFSMKPYQEKSHCSYSVK